MKMFSWKRYIIVESEDTVWKKIKEPDVDMDEIVERYHDKKAGLGGPSPGAGGAKDVIKVTGPQKK